jgi:putative endonuclease
MPGRQWPGMGWLEQKRIDWTERGFAQLASLARRRGRAQSLPAHLLVGIEGETAAIFYLRRNGYIVVAGRWSSGDESGDIDIVAWKGPLLCFVEVKTRTAHDMAPAEAAVDSNKRRILRKLGRAYLRHLGMNQPPPTRFDVLSVYMEPGVEKEFVHFEGAFGWSERPDRDEVR